MELIIAACILWFAGQGGENIARALTPNKRMNLIEQYEERMRREGRL